jgi:hypothetical protein
MRVAKHWCVSVLLIVMCSSGGSLFAQNMNSGDIRGTIETYRHSGTKCCTIICPSSRLLVHVPNRRPAELFCRPVHSQSIDHMTTMIYWNQVI